MPVASIACIAKRIARQRGGEQVVPPRFEVADVLARINAAIAQRAA